MSKVYGFGADTVKRIAGAVRAYEREGKDTSRTPKHPGAYWPAAQPNDTPTTTVGTTAETEAAQTDDWDIYTADGDLKFTTCTRVAYDDTGDETLYAYYRDLHFDFHGRLTHVSAETRAAIEVPEVC